MKILVVEDSAADLRLLSEALKAAGEEQLLQRIGDHAIKVGSRFGIAFYPDHASTLEGLVAGADQVMGGPPRATAG